MANFFKSLFFGDAEETEEQKAKKNFDVLKYDGIRAARIGKTDFAIRCFNEALKIQEDVEIREQLMNAYARENRLEEAEEAAGSLLAVEPDNIEVLLVRARLNYMIEQYDKVVADCQHVVNIDNNEARAHYLAGRARHKSGDREGAVASLSKAIEIKDDFTEACLLRGELMFEAEDFSHGLLDAEKVIGLLPEDEQAYLLRGKCHEAMKDFQDAEHDYRHVTELNPFNEQAYLSLGYLYIAKEQLDEAVSLFNEAIDLEPDFVEAYVGRAKVLEMKGDQEGARADLQKVQELDPSDKETKLKNGTYSDFGDMYKSRPL